MRTVFLIICLGLSSLCFLAPAPKVSPIRGEVDVNSVVPVKSIGSQMTQSKSGSRSSGHQLVRLVPAGIISLDFLPMGAYLSTLKFDRKGNIYLIASFPPKQKELIKFMADGQKHEKIEIAKLSDENLVDFEGHDTAHLADNIRLLALYVFPKYGDAVIRINLGLDRDLGVAGESTPALIAQFLEFVRNAVVQQATATQASLTGLDGGAWAYSVVQQLLPYFDQFMPDSSATIRANLNVIFRGSPPGDRDRLMNSIAGSSIQDLLSKAEVAHDPRQKDTLYRQVVLQALGDGDLDRAFSAVAKISDEGSRANLDSMIRSRAALAAIEKQDIDTACHYAKGLPNIQQRAVLFAQMAGALWDKKDIVRAMEMLNEAERLCRNAENGPHKVRAMITIANVAVRIDVLRGFDLSKSVVEAINHAEIPKASGSANTASPLTKLNFGQSFSLLARIDFDRALFIAQAIERKDVSVLAQLAVCQGVLTKPKQTQSEEQEKRPTTQEKPNTPRSPEDRVREGGPARSKQQSHEKKPALQSVLAHPEGQGSRIS